MRSRAADPVRAGALYFAIVFAAGFVLGAVRTMVLAPHLGALAAVLIELPVMLAIAWAVCRRIVARLGVRRDLASRLTMGIVAFLLLIAAELGLTVLAFGGTAASFLAGLATPAGAVGLAGQVLFGAMPLAVRPARPAPAASGKAGQGRRG